MEYPMVLYLSNRVTESNKTKYARVVELVDSLDSGSSVHSEHAGSTPASRTKRKMSVRASFFLYPTGGNGTDFPTFGK